MLHKFSIISSNKSLQKTQKRNFSSKKLDSGVTVINTNTSPNKLVSNISLYVKAGSRYETKLTRGSTHFLKHLAFRNNTNDFGLTLVRNIECLGGELLCTVDREMIGYHIYGPNGQIHKLAPFLKGIVSPKLWEYEVDEVRSLVQREVDSISSDVPNLIMESLYQNAFRTSGLSQSVYATEFDTSRIVPQHIYEHVKNNFYPPGEKMVIVANGFQSEYEGQEFATIVNESGVAQELDAFDPLPQVSQPNQNVKFVGGQTFVQGGKTVHVGLGFNGAKVGADNYATLLVLKEALGCGAQCGGRFYNLLKENGDIQQANAFNSSFTDAGLFGVYAETTGNAQDLISKIYNELNSLTKITDEEFQAAKNVATGRLLRSNESGLYTNNLTALRFFSNSGNINDVENISKVTKEQLISTLKSYLSSTPSLVTAGDVTGTPAISTLVSSQ